MIRAKLYLSLLAIVAMGGSLSGCCCTRLIGELDPPANGVQVKIEQSLTDAQNKSVEQKLHALVDGTTSHSSMVVNGKATFNISPVDDPQAFADQIDFGTVKKVEGQVIYLEIDENAL